MPENHGWRGGGRIRVARLGAGWVLKLNGVTTRGGRIKARIRDLMRETHPRLRPDYAGLFVVSIWIETAVPGRRIDVDNVAKPCLDGLTGTLWRDDSQVARLMVEKIPGEGETVTVHIAPLHEPPAGSSLTGLLDRVDRADARDS